MRIRLIIQEIKGGFIPSYKTGYFGYETLSQLAPKTWELILVEIKDEESVDCFKRAIKYGNQ